MNANIIVEALLQEGPLQKIRYGLLASFVSKLITGNLPSGVTGTLGKWYIRAFTDSDNYVFQSGHGGTARVYVSFGLSGTEGNAELEGVVEAEFCPAVEGKFELVSTSPVQLKAQELLSFFDAIEDTGSEIAPEMMRLYQLAVKEKALKPIPRMTAEIL